jgi:hypothetical protein
MKWEWTRRDYMKIMNWWQFKEMTEDRSVVVLSVQSKLSDDDVVSVLEIDIDEFRIEKIEIGDFTVSAFMELTMQKGAKWNGFLL